MFCIYGKSLILAKRKVEKELLKGNSKLSKSIKDSMSQTEKQQTVDKMVTEEFHAMKPKRCTHEFSTPSIAMEALQLMRQDKNNFSDLCLMKKSYKKDASGNIRKTKLTGKPMMEWIPLHNPALGLKAA